MSVAKKVSQLMSQDGNIHSQADLAEKTGISRQTINYILSGRVTIPNKGTLEKLVNYFGCSEDFFIGNYRRNSEKLAENLKTLMDINNMSFTQLSKASGVSKSVLSDILNKKRLQVGDRTLQPICALFKITPLELRK